MKKIIITISSVLLGILLLGCPAPKPDKEIELAKEKLEIAKKEEAPTFATDEYSIAEKNFIEATNLVEKGKNEEAKTKALTSITNSEKAITTARKKRAEILISQLDSLSKEASELKMNIVFPEEYNNLVEGYNTSKELYDKENYTDSITNSQRVISDTEPKLKELKDKWNTAKTELNRATSRAERIKRVAKWLAQEVSEIEEDLSIARNHLDNAELDQSISKSKEANEKLDKLAEKLREKNEKELENTGQKLRELKINKLQVKFLHFARNKNLEIIAYTKLKEMETKISLLYTETEPSTSEQSKQKETNISKMSKEELEAYKSELEKEIESLKEEIKLLYNQAKEDYENKNYEDSLEKLEKVNELTELYKQKNSELQKVLEELNKRTRTFTSYKVQPGDFLSKIAGKLFKGEYWWWPKIFTANKDKISDPDIIEINTELIIPNIPQE